MAAVDRHIIGGKGMDALKSYWILTVDILNLLPEACRSHWSCKKWVVSYNILFSSYSVHDLYNCSRLVSGVQNPAILQ